MISDMNVTSVSSSCLDSYYKKYFWSYKLVVVRTVMFDLFCLGRVLCPICTSCGTGYIRRVFQIDEGMIEATAVCSWISSSRPLTQYPSEESGAEQVQLESQASVIHLPYTTQHMAFKSRTIFQCNKKKKDAKHSTWNGSTLLHLFPILHDWHGEECDRNM